MAKVNSYPIGAPCWVDLMSSDVARAREFYCTLFGWTADEPDPQFGGYFNFRKDGEYVGGGMSAMPEAPVQNVWSIYLTTDDARKTLDVAVANGGHVIVPAMDVADLGTMGVVIDPTGAAIGLWQPGVHRGFGVSREHGTPSWFELYARDHGAAVRFYREVFRWDTETVSDTDEFRYTILKSGDEQLAGIADASTWLPGDCPAHWSVYFGVDDTDATLRRIVDLGGTILQPAQDTPYGRLAAAADPLGAAFKLVAPNEAMPAR